MRTASTPKYKYKWTCMYCCVFNAQLFATHNSYCIRYVIVVYVQEWIAGEETSSVSSNTQESSAPPDIVPTTEPNSSPTSVRSVNSVSSISDMPFMIGREDDNLPITDDFESVPGVPGII